MCYTVSYLTKRKIKYAKRAGADADEVKELELELEELGAGQPAMYHVSGFAHPKLLCFARDEGPRFELLRWGLVPHWVKSAAQAGTVSKQTLNARGETVFEKPAFREAFQHRCLILVDGYFEFFHFAKRTYPHLLHMRDEEPFALAGIRSVWKDPDEGSMIGTVSIVTTSANPLMTRIHNNPKADGPRMPFIVPKEFDALWLSPDTPREEVQRIIAPYDEALMEARTVRPLLGKNASPNAPEAVEAYDYPELGLM